MFEESPEAFMARWRPFATDVQLFPHTEGSPLLECGVAGAVVQVLERTGPYRSTPGPARMILNATAETLEAVPDDVPAEQRTRLLETVGISRVRVQGRVLSREGNMVVVDAGAPLVVGVHGALPTGVAAGDTVRFEALPPLHGFVLPRAPAAAAPAGGGPAPTDTDDLV